MNSDSMLLLVLCYYFWQNTTAYDNMIVYTSGRCPNNPQGTSPLTRYRGVAPYPILGGARGMQLFDLHPLG